MARKNVAAVGVSGGVPRVNLMPRAELERRERAFTIRRWGWGVVGALAIVVLVAGAGFGMSWAAKQRLADAQSRTTSLTSQLSALSGVSKALATRTELESFRGQAMGSDLEWLKTMVSLGVVIPDGVVVTGFDLVPGVIPVDGAKPEEQAGLVGTITLESQSPVQIVPVVRAFRKVAGVSSADGSEVTTAEGDSAKAGIYTYLIDITFDQTVYTNAYAKSGDK
jgi:hypothetical protein